MKEGRLVYRKEETLQEGKLGYRRARLPGERLGYRMDGRLQSVSPEPGSSLLICSDALFNKIFLGTFFHGP